MPIETILPTGSGTLNQFTAFGGTRPAIVNTADDATTYVWFARNVAKTDRIAHTQLPANAGSVSLVQSTYRVIHTSTGSPTVSKGGFYESTAVWGTATATTAGWTTKTYTVANPPAGGAWTVANVNSANLTINHDGSSDGGNAVNFTYYAGLITWAPGTGGFFYLINSVIGSLLGSNILESAWGSVMSAFHKARPTTLFSPEECLKAYIEMKECVHVSHFI